MSKKGIFGSDSSGAKKKLHSTDAMRGLIGQENSANTKTQSFSLYDHNFDEIADIIDALTPMSHKKKVKTAVAGRVALSYLAQALKSGNAKEIKKIHEALRNNT